MNQPFHKLKSCETNVLVKLFADKNYLAAATLDVQEGVTVQLLSQAMCSVYGDKLDGIDADWSLPGGPQFLVKSGCSPAW